MTKTNSTTSPDAATIETLRAIRKDLTAAAHRIKDLPYNVRVMLDDQIHDSRPDSSLNQLWNDLTALETYLFRTAEALEESQTRHERGADADD